MNSITFSKNTSFYNEFYYQKTSVFTVFLKNGPIWDLCFFKNISFYNEFGIFLSACFKNIRFYNEFCMLFAQDETKTYLCSKTSVFTMNYAHFFKNIRFYNELCTLLHRLAQTSLDQPRLAQIWIPRNAGRFLPVAQTSLDQPRLAQTTKSIQKSCVFKNISFYNEFYHFFQKHPFLQ